MHLSLERAQALLRYGVAGRADHFDEFKVAEAAQLVYRYDAVVDPALAQNPSEFILPDEMPLPEYSQDLLFVFCEHVLYLVPTPFYNFRIFTGKFPELC